MSELTLEEVEKLFVVERGDTWHAMLSNEQVFAIGWLIGRVQDLQAKLDLPPDAPTSRGDYLEPVLDALLRIERKVDAILRAHEAVTPVVHGTNHYEAAARIIDGAPTRTPEEQGCT